MKFDLSRIGQNEVLIKSEDGMKFDQVQGLDED
jgi:hypothetical protein